MYPSLPDAGDSDGDAVHLPLIEDDEEGEKEEDPGKEGDPPPTKKQPLPPLYIVGEGLPVIPSRLVAKIQKEEFLTWLSY